VLEEGQNRTAAFAIICSTQTSLIPMGGWLQIIEASGPGNREKQDAENKECSHCNKSDSYPSKKQCFCGGVVFFVDRGLLMGGKCYTLNEPFNL